MYLYSDKTTGIVKLAGDFNPANLGIFPYDILEVEEFPYLVEKSYVKNGLVYPLPSKPAVESTWDLSSETWIVQIEVIQAKKILLSRKLEQLRQEQENSNIAYSGTFYQINPEAQKNITQKLKEVESRLRLGYFEGLDLFWRDANNTFRFWADENKTIEQNAQEFYDWLSMLQIKATTRGTNLYSILWSKKAQIASLQTLEEIDSFDLTFSWE